MEKGRLKGIDKASHQETQAHHKRGKKAKWNNVAQGLRGNKKSFYKYTREKEQNREKNTAE